MSKNQMLVGNLSLETMKSVVDESGRLQSLDCINHT